MEQTKSRGTPSKRCYLGHAVSENRHGLIVEASVAEASGTAERSAAVEMLEGLSEDRRCTVGADKVYDTRGFVADLRELNVTPHRPPQYGLNWNRQLRPKIRPQISPNPRA